MNENTPHHYLRYNIITKIRIQAKKQGRSLQDPPLDTGGDDPAEAGQPSRYTGGDDGAPFDSVLRYA